MKNYKTPITKEKHNTLDVKVNDLVPFFAISNNFEVPSVENDSDLQQNSITRSV